MQMYWHRSLNYSQKPFHERQTFAQCHTTLFFFQQIIIVSDTISFHIPDIKMHGLFLSLRLNFYVASKYISQLDDQLPIN